jgi:hypothetical protein
MVRKWLTLDFRFGYTQKNDDSTTLGRSIALKIGSQGSRHFWQPQASCQLRRERTDNLGGLKIASTSPDEE